MIFVSQIERITEEQVRSVSGTLKLSMTIIVPISVRMGLADDGGDIFRIIGHTAHDVSVGAAVQIRDREIHDLVKEIPA